MKSTCIYLQPSFELLKLVKVHFRLSIHLEVLRRLLFLFVFFFFPAIMCTFRAAIANCGPDTKHLRILTRPQRKRKTPTSPDARTHKQQTNGVIRTVVIGKLDCVEKGLVMLPTVDLIIHWLTGTNLNRKTPMYKG